MKQVILDLCAIENCKVGLGEFSLQLGKHLLNQLSRLNDNGIDLKYIVPKGFKNAFGDDGRCIECSRIDRFILRLKLKCDLFHSVHQYGRIKYLLGAKKTLLTIHDLNFIYEKKGNKIEKYRRKIGKQICNADALTFISKFTKSDVERIYPEYKRYSEVIYNGVSDLTGYQIPKDGEYLLHLSSLMPKKNPELLVRMMEWLPDYKLLIVGNLDSKYAQNMKALAENLPMKNVKFIGPVDDKQKAELYASCKMFLFPSLCEGFGLPPIEAMKFGKPVALSNLTSLPEVGGDVAFYWNNLEPEIMASELNNYLKNTVPDREAIKKRAAFFNWNNCAKQYAELYIKLLSEQF